MPMHKRSRAGGFTLLEVLVVLLVAAVLLTLGVPLLNNMIQRSQLEGYARRVAILVQQARYSAIKKANTQSVVYMDVANQRIAAYADVDNDSRYDTTKGDYELGADVLPPGVSFAFPTGDPGLTKDLTQDPAGSATSPHIAVMRPDGSIQNSGSFRVADRHGNYLEVSISPQGTARVQVLKWDGAGWREQGYNGKPWTWN